ncbi:hypothetical protein DQ02_24035 [Citrobacter amalonaticus]|nr:hypothetical protein DQ02_24035 [Citrobacter amalonaticus]
MINRLFENGSHADLAFTNFIGFTYHIFKNHASPCIANLFFHPRGLRTIVITVFGKQNTDIRLKAFKIHIPEQITKHIEKLQCRSVIEQLCRGGNNQHISSAYDIDRANTEVRCAVDNNHIIVMSDRFNSKAEHQMRVGGQFSFIKFAHQFSFNAMQCQAGRNDIKARPAGWFYRITGIILFTKIKGQESIFRVYMKIGHPSVIHRGCALRIITLDKQNA